MMCFLLFLHAFSRVIIAFNGFIPVVASFRKLPPGADHIC